MLQPKRNAFWRSRPLYGRRVIVVVILMQSSFLEQTCNHSLLSKFPLGKDCTTSISFFCPRLSKGLSIWVVISEWFYLQEENCKLKPAFQPILSVAFLCMKPKRPLKGKVLIFLITKITPSHKAGERNQLIKHLGLVWKRHLNI